MVKKRGAFMGPRLRRIRREQGLTQLEMANDLNVSPSYIALIERNQRPMTAEMLIRLADTYRLDLSAVTAGDDNQAGSRLMAATQDSLFSDLAITDMEIEDFGNGYPVAAEAFSRLYAAYQQSQIALADREEGHDSPHDPITEVRRFLSKRRNSFPSIDNACEQLTKKIVHLGDFESYLQTQKWKVRRLPLDVMDGSLRRLNQHRREIRLAEGLDRASFTFQLALQVAYLQMKVEIDDAIGDYNFYTESGKRLTKRALANYAAGALLMPYGEFVKQAEERRYDIEALARQFGVSFEQAAHRLTTLQKPGEEGVPFFFIRVDAAGNVSKRLDGAGFPFARHGGSCPLWSLHQAFREPRRILTEWVALPDGEKFFSIVRTVTAGGGAYGAQRIERAIALGCSEAHAHRLVYARMSDITKDNPTPIGVSCRLCQRVNSIARAEPPIGRKLSIDDHYRASAQFDLADD